ncbi:MAG: DNA-binding protein WhiA [Clostridia bacterium]|nr:DNA-binding protein WhiA [Clostridia bacterium]
MSFSSDIKTELCELRLPEYAKMPLIYGFLLFSRSFSVSNIKMQTETKAVAELFCELLNEVYSVKAQIETGGGKKTVYRIEVISEADRLKLLASVDFGIYEGKINLDELKGDSQIACFVRGAFLACGQISDPKKTSRVDFLVRDKKRAEEFRSVLKDHYIETNLAVRQNAYVVYIKRNEMVTNLLALIGASSRSLELIEMSILSSVRNNMNRAANCDNANLDRMVEASIKQRKAIDFLRKKGILQTLDGKLIYAAKLRVDNPEMSIKELCALSDEKISPSGLNHRLKRLVELYQERNKN